MKKQQANFIWLDLEMTGLNPESDVILEIATIITDPQLNIIAEGPDYVIHYADEVLATMNDWSKEQHELSGLTKAVKNSTISLEQAEQDTFDLIAEFCAPNESMLAGNSVWVDRIFLKKYMPKIVNYLHYKLIDVSSVQQLVQAWYPHNPEVEFKKTESHRALDDIKESIAELLHYRKYFFIP